MALFPRKGGFLLSERWLRQNGSLALFDRIMHWAQGHVTYVRFVMRNCAKNAQDTGNTFRMLP